MASKLITEVKHKQASSNTVYHCLYGYYFLGIKKSKLAHIYAKHRSTIGTWIKNFESTGCHVRQQNVKNVYKKFSEEKRKWLLSLYEKKPILYQEEAKQLFYDEFQITISGSSISTILHEAGLTYKVFERRAIQMQISDVIRFTNELIETPWLVQNLVFLDEVSFDNRDMLRKYGYALKGKRLLFRGEFRRKARVSLLCFLGIEGILDTFLTDGTFTRLKFLECCRQFALSSISNVQQYPGRHSIWILDGAKIHCDMNLVMYLRASVCALL